MKILVMPFEPFGKIKEVNLDVIIYIGQITRDEISAERAAINLNDAAI